MDKFGYMFAAFTLVWIALVIYILVLGQKQKHLRQEIDQLKATLEKESK